MVGESSQKLREETTPAMSAFAASVRFRSFPVLFAFGLNFFSFSSFLLFFLFF